MDDLDVYFVNFFYEVIKDQLEENTCSTHKYCLRTIQRHPAGSSGSFSSSAMRCAYVYHTAPCLASVLYRHFHQLLSNNTFVLRRIAIRQNFRICSFTTGLSVDFVVLASLLKKMLPGYCYSRNLVEIEVFIVRNDTSWNLTAMKMAKRISKELLETSLLNFNFRFVDVDFDGSLTDDVKAIVRQSDLVTSVNFLSTICDVNQGSYQHRIIQEVIHSMQEGGIMFFLDSPERISCDTLKKILDTCDEPLAEIYGPLNYDVHRMRLLCRKECTRLYCKHYGWRCSLLEKTNCISAWYKRRSEYC